MVMNYSEMQSSVSLKTNHSIKRSTFKLRANNSLYAEVAFFSFSKIDEHANAPLPCPSGQKISRARSTISKGKIEGFWTG